MRRSQQSEDADLTMIFASYLGWVHNFLRIKNYKMLQAWSHRPYTTSAPHPLCCPASSLMAIGPRWMMGVGGVQV